ncbi:glycosyltransferase [Endozoicomonas sp. G2_2]|uniref:glycosyltransferase n=1 Tax=Endozoicomonas sp. G2_2 TaxID=2821092 RepID=UPI001ADCC210|nr:glycosyltransferase [Endozoicomonas sp. G2_2]MBO9470142.1 glycosyltransferase [Endozoicomonas sp. G2_2]
MIARAKVLQFVPGFRFGGVESFLLDFLRIHAEMGLAYDFVVDTLERMPQFDEIEQLGGRIWSMGRYLDAPIRYQRKFAGILRDHAHEYRALHVHSALRGVPLLAAVRKYDMVRIVHSHTYSFLGSRRAYAKPLLAPLASWFATTRLACSEPAGRFMFSNCPFTVIRNAIDLDRFRYSAERREEVRRAHGIPADALVLGHTGRFAFAKNHEWLMRVFSALSSQRPNSRLMLVGEGPLRSATEQLAHDLGVLDRVLFVGQQDDVSPFMSAMDIFLMPSHFEGLGISLIEAQANGLQCVISKNIPNDAIICPGVYPVSLNLPVDAWVSRILALSPIRANNSSSHIALLRDEGYDVQMEAAKLRDIYLARVGDPIAL